MHQTVGTYTGTSLGIMLAREGVISGCVTRGIRMRDLRSRVSAPAALTVERVGNLLDYDLPALLVGKQSNHIPLEVKS